MIDDRPKDVFWVTREGQKIRPRDMDDNHLINTLKMLERLAEKKRWFYLREGFCALSFLNGDMAILEVENGISQLSEIHWTELISPDLEDVVDEMWSEKRKRGI